MRTTLILALHALWLSLLLPASAQAGIDELLGKYATTDDGCQGEPAPEFEIRRGVIEGPDLLCLLGVPQEASGPGLESYQAKCTQQDGVHLGTLTFDLSAKDNYIKIHLPEKQDWIALYACK